MKVALETYILAEGHLQPSLKLVRALSEVGRSAAGGLKGDACIDWDDKKARAALLGRIDADRLLELSRRTQEHWTRTALSARG